MAITYQRAHTKKQVTCLSVTTTTKMNTTTDYSGSTINVGAYKSGVFVLNTTFNSTGAVGVYVDGSCDGGTTWGNALATLDADITTTANTIAVAAESLPENIRIRVQHATTSATFALTVVANFIA